MRLSSQQFLKTLLRPNLAYTTDGPALGSQFANKALWAILAVILVIVLYIAFAFRHVSRPVPSWGYGLTVVAMLVIGIIVPTGFFAAYHTSLVRKLILSSSLPSLPFLATA